MDKALPHDHIVAVQNSEELTDFGASHRSTPTWRQKYREYLSELFATFIFVSIGSGSVAQQVLSSGSGLIGSIGYGIGLTIAVMIAAPVSGGHVSPSITLALASFRSFPMRKVPGYILCQFIGAFLGASLVFLINFSKIIEIEFATTVGLFTTIPNSHLAIVFFVQIFGTAFLLIGVQAAADSKNIPSWMFPIAVGILLVGIGLAFPGVALNPAIDLSGRIVASIVGQNTLPFTENSGYFIIPIFAPPLGAILGVAAYDFMIITLPSP